MVGSTVGGAKGGIEAHRFETREHATDAEESTPRNSRVVRTAAPHPERFIRELIHVSPASFIARGISGFRINHFHRFPVRRFSALSSVIPTSRPRTSGETQPFVG